MVAAPNGHFLLHHLELLCYGVKVEQVWKESLYGVFLLSSFVGVDLLPVLSASASKGLEPPETTKVSPKG